MGNGDATGRDAPGHDALVAVAAQVLAGHRPAGDLLGKGVATSLNNLAALHKAQGRYAEAEPLYRRSLAIWEKALGPEHPNVATSLENYAALLREIGRTAEADKMEARAKAIRDKRAKENK